MNLGKKEGSDTVLSDRQEVITVAFPIRRGSASLQGRLLAASLRKFLTPEFRIVAFKDRHSVPLSRETRETLESCAVEICDIDTPMVYRYSDYSLIAVDALSASFCRGQVIFMDPGVIVKSSIDWRDSCISANNMKFSARPAFRKNIVEQSVLRDLIQGFLAYKGIAGADGCKRGIGLYNPDVVCFDAQNGFPDAWRDATSWILRSKIGGETVLGRAGQIALSLLNTATLYTCKSLPSGWNEGVGAAAEASIVNYRNFSEAITNKHILNLILGLCEDKANDELDILGELSFRDIKALRNVASDR